jgi:hypothetical protein
MAKPVDMKLNQLDNWKATFVAGSQATLVIDVRKWEEMGRPSSVLVHIEGWEIQAVTNG